MFASNYVSYLSTLIRCLVSAALDMLENVIES